MRIGVLGGTFDPPHNGHLAIALAAIEQLSLDEVIIIPASRNPIKDTRTVASGAHRLGMVEAMVREADNPRLAVSDLELTRGGPSYTVDTISELQMVRPADYWFLMGADSLKSLAAWKQPQRLLKLCRLGVVTRPNLGFNLITAPDDVRAHVDPITLEAMAISSRDIRDRFALKQDVAALLPREVIKYIHMHRLYSV